MTVAVSIIESNVFKTLGDFLVGVVPSTCDVLRGQVNRVAEPAHPDFCILWATLQNRLKTNERGMDDVAYVGSIAGTALTISAMLAGNVAVGQVLTGQGIAAGTQIISGSGLHWVVAPSQTVTSTTIQSGTSGVLQGTMITVQIDIHGPNGADNAQIISTLFRDQYAVDQFAGSGFDITPLYSDDPRQMPFLNAEQQYEDRWVVNAVMQSNPVVTVPQQYADALAVEVINVDATYPP